MNISKSKFKLGIWYEDICNNVVSKEDPSACGYRHFNPLLVQDDFHSYRWHPTNLFIRLICKFKPIYHYFNRRFTHKKTVSYMGCIRTDISSEHMQKLIVALVNSGKYNLLESMYIAARACERCTNVLTHEYLQEGGYSELSNDWKEANTCCEFCKDLGYHNRT